MSGKKNMAQAEASGLQINSSCLLLLHDHLLDREKPPLVWCRFWNHLISAERVYLEFISSDLLDIIILDYHVTAGFAQDCSEPSYGRWNFKKNITLIVVFYSWLSWKMARRIMVTSCRVTTGWTSISGKLSVPPGMATSSGECLNATSVALRSNIWGSPMRSLIWLKKRPILDREEVEAWAGGCRIEAAGVEVDGEWVRIWVGVAAVSTAEINGEEWVEGQDLMAWNERIKSDISAFSSRHYYFSSKMITSMNYNRTILNNN